MVDLEKIIERMKVIVGASKDIQIADIFKLSPQDFNKRKKRGTLLSFVIEWAINQKVDMNRLLLGQEGEGDPYLKEGAGVEGGVLDEDPEVAELLAMTRDIIKSHTEYALSLSMNVRSFHRAMNMEQKVQDHEERLSELEKKGGGCCDLKEEGSKRFVGT